jgi:hypothetical protein
MTAAIASRMASFAFVMLGAAVGKDFASPRRRFTAWIKSRVAESSVGFDCGGAGDAAAGAVGV